MRQEKIIQPRLACDKRREESVGEFHRIAETCIFFVDARRRAGIDEDRVITQPGEKRGVQGVIGVD